MYFLLLKVQNFKKLRFVMLKKMKISMKLLSKYSIKKIGNLTLHSLFLRSKN